MKTSDISRLDIAAWCIFTGGLLILLYLGLLPSLLAGLLVFSLINVLVPKIRSSKIGQDGSQILAVTFIAGIVIALIIFAGASLVSYMQGGGESIPGLINRMAEIIEHSRDRLPHWLLQYLPADADALRTALVDWLRGHTDMFKVAGTELGRGLAHILIGMVIGALLSLESATSMSQCGPLTRTLAHSGLKLSLAFRRVVFAQFWISTLNTIFTAIYLIVILPLFGVELPLTKTLILVTFIVGLLPILGNLISNTVIFIVSLSQSLFVALASLAYLILIHKMEYFLNARIIGSHIRARAWEMLISMLFMEAAFGITGLIAAPIYYAYIKDELRAKNLV